MFFRRIPYSPHQLAHAATLALMACSSPSSSPSTPPAPGDAPTGEPVARLCDPTPCGYIGVGTKGAGLEGQHFVVGEFRSRAPRVCLTTIGACTVASSLRSCLPDFDAGPDIPFPWPNPGGVDVTGGMMALRLEPDADGFYSSDALHSIGGALFAGGESLAFVAAGGTVPSFSASLVTPTPVTITSGAGDTQHDRTKPLTIHWTGASEGFVKLAFWASGDV